MSEFNQDDSQPSLKRLSQETLRTLKALSRNIPEIAYHLNRAVDHIGSLADSVKSIAHNIWFIKTLVEKADAEDLVTCDVNNAQDWINVAWADVPQGAQVWVGGKQNGEFRAYGPYFVLIKDPRVLKSGDTGGHCSHDHPEEDLLIPRRGKNIVLTGS